MRKTRHHRARAALAAAAVIGGLGWALVGATPAWAPTCGASCGMRPGSGPPQAPKPPTSTRQCKDGGWQHYTDGAGFAFTNQGGCVSYVASGGHGGPGTGRSSEFPGNPG